MAEYKLMQHQKDAVDFLDRMDGVGALLFDPGTGKTGSTLAWIDKLAKTKGEVRVLVFAPLTAVDTWVLQAPKFMDSVVKARMMQGPSTKILKGIAQSRSWGSVVDAKIATDHKGSTASQVSGNRVTILSVSVGMLSAYCSSKEKTVELIKAVRTYKPDVMVVDESHIIKSAYSKVSVALYQIAPLAPHRIILTGTVMPHSPFDVYGQWRFLAPWTFSHDPNPAYAAKPSRMTKADWEEVDHWSWDKFKARYSVSSGGRGSTPFTDQTDLRNRVAVRSMVVRKEDALDLPPVTDIDIHITLSPKEQRAYDEMRKDLAAEMEDGSLLTAPNALAKIMKLRQITAGFARDTQSEEVHEIGHTKRRAVKEVVETQLAGENRVVVFAYFRSECRMIAESLKAKGVTVEVITGATSVKDRLAIRERFADVSGNPGRIILVAQARTMSLSVNELVTAQNAVFASLSERRNDWVQSRDRLDRNGQKGSHVTFWNVYAPGTVDEVMLDRHKDRGDLEKALLDHIRATPRRRL